jgi:hypothetical protein
LIVNFQMISTTMIQKEPCTSTLTTSPEWFTWAASGATTTKSWLH